MDTVASEITSLTIVYSSIYSDADQRKHQSSASLAFVWGIHRWPVNSPHKWSVTRKMFQFDDVIMWRIASRVPKSIYSQQALHYFISQMLFHALNWHEPDEIEHCSLTSPLSPRMAFTTQHCDVIRTNVSYWQYQVIFTNCSCTWISSVNIDLLSPSFHSASCLKS